MLVREVLFGDVTAEAPIPRVHGAMQSAGFLHHVRDCCSAKLRIPEVT